MEAAPPQSDTTAASADRLAASLEGLAPIRTLVLLDARAPRSVRIWTRAHDAERDIAGTLRQAWARYVYFQRTSRAEPRPDDAIVVAWPAADNGAPGSGAITLPLVTPARAVFGVAHFEVSGSVDELSLALLTIVVADLSRAFEPSRGGPSPKDAEDLLATVAHDLLAPLGAIVATVEAMLEGAPHDRRRLERLLASTARARAAAKNLLAVSTLERPAFVRRPRR
ncbi:MAG TPA: histidine kinase dimerization/phospho-acceptor domain-containing protein, partial [Minicystis sp.]|nr:histidine kinase dimerization/phospho-acceptor domain-containing protein [Minicystis sp.]